MEFSNISLVCPFFLNFLLIKYFINKKIFKNMYVYMTVYINIKSQY